MPSVNELLDAVPVNNPFPMSVRASNAKSQRKISQVLAEMLRYLRERKQHAAERALESGVLSAIFSFLEMMNEILDNS